MPVGTPRRANVTPSGLLGPWRHVRAVRDRILPRQERDRPAAAQRRGKCGSCSAAARSRHCWPGGRAILHRRGSPPPCGPLPRRFRVARHLPAPRILDVPRPRGWGRAAPAWLRTSWRGAGRRALDSTWHAQARRKGEIRAGDGRRDGRRGAAFTAPGLGSAHCLSEPRLHGAAPQAHTSRRHLALSRPTCSLHLPQAAPIACVTTAAMVARANSFATFLIVGRKFCRSPRPAPSWLTCLLTSHLLLPRHPLLLLSLRLQCPLARSPAARHP